MKIRRVNSRAVVLALLLPAAMVSFDAAATGVPVVDAVHIQTSLKTQIDALMQYAKQLQGMAKDAAHYKMVYDHYQQQLIKVKGMVSQLSFSGTQPLSPVDPYEGVEQRCNKKPSGMSLKSLVSAIAPDPKANIIEQQKSICEGIVMSQNAKYNETIDFLTRVREETQKELSTLLARRDSQQTNGGVDANTDDALQTGTRLDTLHRDYVAKLQMFDANISALTDRQRALAQQAMDGDRGPIGTLIKTGALETALKVGN